MKLPGIATDFFMTVLSLAALGMIGFGFYLLISTEAGTAPVTRNLGDSTIKTTVVNDTIRKDTFKHRMVTTTTVTMHGDHKICERCKPYTDDLVKARYDNSFKLIGTGIVIILLLLLLPSLHDFNLFGLLSGTFKDDIKNLKQLHNDGQEQLATSPAIHAFSRSVKATGAGPAGSPENNSRKLTATAVAVTGAAGEYLVTLTVNSTSLVPLKGFVTFLLPPFFPNPNPKIFVIDGQARLQVRTTAAFIAGAEADDGATKLKLDLATLPEFAKK